MSQLALTAPPIIQRMSSYLSLRNILVVAIVLRMMLPLLSLAVTGSTDQFYAKDTGSYLRSATSLVREGQFARDGEPEIQRTPGYPMLLIPGILLGRVELVTIGLQILLSALTIFLVYQITLLLFESKNIALAAAAIYAVEPLSILYSSKLLSETLFTTLISLFIFLLVKYLKQGSWKYLIISALALTASVYVRPIAYYLPILAAALLFAGLVARKSLVSRQLLHVGAFALVCLVLLGVWQLRNKAETGYSGFSTAAEESLYYWDAAAILASQQGISVDEMRDRMGFMDPETYFRSFPEQRNWETGEIFKSIGSEARTIILDNLGTYSELALKGAIRMLVDPVASEYLRMFRVHPHPEGFIDKIREVGVAETSKFLLERSPVALWSLLIFGSAIIVTLALAMLGLTQSRMSKALPMILISGMIFYFLMLSAVGLGTSRGRHPIMPMVCVLAGYGFIWIANWARTRRSLHQKFTDPAAEGSTR